MADNVIALEMCDLPISLSSSALLSVNDWLDSLWVKTAKWFVGLISLLRQ